MADEVQYGTDSLTDKRKYEDQTTPHWPATGFSDQPDSGDLPPPTNYNYDYNYNYNCNSIPQPVSDFEIAKQRAREIAARFLTEAKRPRVENGGSGFDSVDNVVQKPMISNMAPSSIPVSYGYAGSSKKIEIPNGRVGVIIGKFGETIKYLQLQSGAKIQVTRDMEADLNCPTRPVELTGTPEQIAKAEQLIQEVLSEAEAGGSGLVNRRVPGQQSGEQYVTKIPNNKVGLVIGKGGETIKNMQATLGARIQRKYEDQTTPPWPATGFSDQPDSGDLPPPTNYNYDYNYNYNCNSIPQPVSDFEIAKQRAREIAARFLTEAKRPRVENGGSGFDSVDNVVQNPMISNMAPSSIPVSYGGYPGASKKIEIPNGRVGVIIGKAGETIKYLQLQSGAKIQVTRDMEADLNCPTRPVELTGTPEQIAKAEQLIQEILSEAEAGGSGLVNRRVPGQQSGEQYVTKIPNNKVGLVIGKGGETIKNMQATSDSVIPLHLPPGDTSTERTLQIDGTTEQRFKLLTL